MNDRTKAPDPDSTGTAQKSREADMRHAARSGSVQVLTLLAQAMLPLAQVLFARLFGAATFGAYQASVALIEALVRGGTGGADKAMLRYVAGFRANKDEEGVFSALHTGLRQGLVVGGALTLILVLGARPLAVAMGQPELATSLRLMAPAIVFTGLMYILVQATLAAKVTGPNFIVRGVCEPTFLLSAGLIAAAFGPDLRNLALGHVFATLATLLVALAVVRNVFKPNAFSRILKGPRLGGFAAFALPLGMSEFLNAVLQRADIVMLAAFGGVRNAGIYAAAEFLGRIVANVRYAFDSIAASVLSEALHLSDSERLQYNLKLMTRWVISVAVPLAAIIIALREDLLGLYGKDFTVAATSMIVLAVGHLVNASNLTPWLLVVGGRSKLMLLGNLFAAFFNIALGIVLIPRYGILGTACAVTASTIALHTFFGVQTWRIQRVHPFDRNTAKPLVAGASMLLIQLQVRAHVEGPWGIALTLLSGLALYVGILVVLGLPDEERSLLLRLRRVRR